MSKHPPHKFFKDLAVVYVLNRSVSNNFLKQHGVATKGGLTIDDIRVLCKSSLNIEVGMQEIEDVLLAGGLMSLFKKTTTIVDSKEVDIWSLHNRAVLITPDDYRGTTDWVVNVFTCPECDTNNPTEASYCMGCGVPVELTQEVKDRSKTNILVRFMKDYDESTSK
jgi:hypothetical protein